MNMIPTTTFTNLLRIGIIPLGARVVLPIYLLRHLLQ